MDPYNPSSSWKPTSRRNIHRSRGASLLATANPETLACLLARNRLFWGDRSQSVKQVPRVTVQGQANPNKRPGSGSVQSDATQTEKTEKRKKKPRKSTRMTVSPSRENILPVGHLKTSDQIARCNAKHEGRKLLQERLTVRIDSLFNMLFSSSAFLRNFHERRNATDLCMGAWTRNADGLNERIVTLTVALQASLGPKTSRVTETQVMRECTQPGLLYSIDVRSVNEDIPYADAFVVMWHFCLKATVEQHTDVMVFAEIHFIKSVWAVVKTFIEKNAYAGLEEFCHSLYSALLIEIKKM